jgi:serine protease Do
MSAWRLSRCGPVLAALLSVSLLACSPRDTAVAGGDADKQVAPQAVTLPNFVHLVKEQGPTVVNISAESPPDIPNGVLSLPEGDPMLEFYRRFGVVPDEGALHSSLGSGFIISADGYILTNAHVVSETEEIMVKLTNKREYPAEIVGVDLLTDIALLKIDATNLQPVKIGDATRLEPGEWVAAIGAPFGFENSVTVGVVSAKGRMLPNESYVPFIQTDVAVNPGNSGGPLFSTEGNVVGINSQIYSETGGYMGISFAIPVDIAMHIAQQLREKGKVTRGRIGVQVQELTVELASSFGLEEPRGALVAAVEQGGPAARAGMRVGDVILSVNDAAVESAADLARFIASTQPGVSAAAEVWRQGERLPLTIQVGELK